MHEIFDKCPYGSECESEDCVYKTVYDIKHLHFFHYVCVVGGQFFTLIPYVSCEPLINFKKLEGC